jgi:magnesium chelatase family protein
MDELSLWSSQILNGLRESMETGYVSIARANSHVKYPARSQLIAAMNPCPCGKAFEADNQCTKMPLCSQNYISRVPGPIMDRFGMTIRVQRTNPWENVNTNRDKSAHIRARVIKARDIQYKRNGELLNNQINSSSNEIFNIDQKAETFMTKFAQNRNLSSRKYYNTKRVARTIADLDGNEKISVHHLQEALTYC